MVGTFTPILLGVSRPGELLAHLSSSYLPFRSPYDSLLLYSVQASVRYLHVSFLSFLSEGNILQRYHSKEVTHTEAETDSWFHDF